MLRPRLATTPLSRKQHAGKDLLKGSPHSALRRPTAGSSTGPGSITSPTPSKVGTKSPASRQPAQPSDETFDLELGVRVVCELSCDEVEAQYRNTQRQIERLQQHLEALHERAMELCSIYNMKLCVNERTGELTFQPWSERVVAQTPVASSVGFRPSTSDYVQASAPLEETAHLAFLDVQEQGLLQTPQRPGIAASARATEEAGDRYLSVPLDSPGPGTPRAFPGQARVEDGVGYAQRQLTSPPRDRVLVSPSGDCNVSPAPRKPTLSAATLEIVRSVLSEDGPPCSALVSHPPHALPPRSEMSPEVAPPQFVAPPLSAVSTFTMLSPQKQPVAVSTATSGTWPETRPVLRASAIVRPTRAIVSPASKPQVPTTAASTTSHPDPVVPPNTATLARPDPSVPGAEPVAIKQPLAVQKPTGSPRKAKPATFTFAAPILERDSVKENANTTQNFDSSCAQTSHLNKASGQQPKGTRKLVMEKPINFD